MTAMMKTCLELKASLNGKSAVDLHDLVEGQLRVPQGARRVAHERCRVQDEVPLNNAPLFALSGTRPHTLLRVNT